MRFEQILCFSKIEGSIIPQRKLIFNEKGKLHNQVKKICKMKHFSSVHFPSISQIQCMNQFNAQKVKFSIKDFLSKRDQKQ